MGKIIKKRRILFLIILCLILFVQVEDVYASNAETILENATQNIEDIEQSIEEAEQLESELEAEQKKTEAMAKELDSQIAAYNKELVDIQEQIVETYSAIKETEIDLAIATGNQDKQYHDMKMRIRYIYENSTTNEIYELLMIAKSMRDFLNKLEYAQQITNYDRERLEEYQLVVQEVQDVKKQLEIEENRLVALQFQVEKKQSKVQELLQEAELTIEELKESIGDNGAILEALMEEAEIERLRQIEAQEAIAAAKKAEEEAAKAAAAATTNQSNQGTNYSTAGADLVSGSGIFAHPIPEAKYISSPFGYRYYPNPNVPTLHKGTDFAAYTGTPVYAVLDGKVTISKYSTSAGYYISIDHGNGIVTLYMHNSVLFVKSGDTVGRGQNIALSGNTGSSSGPHLHFQVMYNGNPIDGTKYL